MKTVNSKMTHRAQTARKMANALGWFSIGLGLIELVAPGKVNAPFGLKKTALTQSYGFREIAAGVGILVSQNPEPWLWARVAGDALDMATLASGFEKRPLASLAGLATVSAVTFLDVYCAYDVGEASKGKLAKYDYSDRSGLPHAPEKMRGIAAAS